MHYQSCKPSTLINISLLPKVSIKTGLKLVFNRSCTMIDSSCSSVENKIYLIMLNYG